MTASLSPRELFQQQAEWLAAARDRLLRRAGIGRRKSILDLGCGPGAVTEELARRCGGTVVALDHRAGAFGEGAGCFGASRCVCGDARRLPFGDGVCDLVFSQFSLLWMDAGAVVPEIARVLRPDGVCVALEPDYGGMIEHPPEIALQQVWVDALTRAGADPCIGRKLPSVFARAGFSVQVDFLDRLFPPAAARYDLLAGLPLTPEEQKTVQSRRAAEEKTPGAEIVVFLPLFLITATKSSAGNGLISDT
ncbi:MAG: methyltransferase domain-containing protein [Pirellulales bacterium]|nr:methyltransferase domain-containing protein [Pirellulales bacterium]